MSDDTAQYTDGTQRSCPDCSMMMELVDPETTPGPKRFECTNCFRSFAPETE